MKKDIGLIVGKIYQSKTHGTVEYIGTDMYMGQMTFMFRTEKYGITYWLPSNLAEHLDL